MSANIPVTKRLGVRNLLVFIIVLAFAYPATAQTHENSFVIAHLSEKTDKTALQSAMESGHWDHYRFISKRRILRFADGTRIELLSQKELNDLGIAYDTHVILPDDTPTPSEPTYRLLENGTIRAEYNSVNKK